MTNGNQFFVQNMNSEISLETKQEILYGRNLKIFQSRSESFVIEDPLKSNFNHGSRSNHFLDDAMLYKSVK